MTKFWAGKRSKKIVSSWDKWGVWTLKNSNSHLCKEGFELFKLGKLELLSQMFLEFIWQNILSFGTSGIAWSHHVQQCSAPPPEFDMKNPPFIPSFPVFLTDAFPSCPTRNTLNTNHPEKLKSWPYFSHLYQLFSHIFSHVFQLMISPSEPPVSHGGHPMPHASSLGKWRPMVSPWMVRRRCPFCGAARWGPGRRRIANHWFTGEYHWGISLYISYIYIFIYVERERDIVYVNVCMCIYICVCVFVCVCYV